MPRTKRPNGNGKVTPAEDFPLTTYPPFMTLTVRQRNFVMLYWLKPLKRWSNAYIYRKAFYRPDMDDNTAWVESSRLLRNPKILPCLAKLDAVRLDRLNLTVDRIVEEETSIAFSDVGYLFDEEGLSPLSPAELPPEVRKAISGCEVKETKIVQHDKETGEETGLIIKRMYKYSFWDKGRALERLAKIRGINAPEKKVHEISGPGGRPLETKTVTEVDIKNLPTEDLHSLVGIAARMAEAEEKKAREEKR